MGETLTKGDVAKIQAEIDERKLVIRPKAIEEVKITRAQGDLSENFEYHEAKRFKNQNDSRIRYLERMLKNANIIDDSSQSDEVGINNTVTLLFDDGHQDTFQLVTSIRGNSLKKLVSIESPIGKAILGKKTGETTQVKVNDEFTYNVTIKSIENTKDSDALTIKKF